MRTIKTQTCEMLCAVLALSAVLQLAAVLASAAVESSAGYTVDAVVEELPIVEDRRASMSLSSASSASGTQIFTPIDRLHI